MQAAREESSTAVQVLAKEFEKKQSLLMDDMDFILEVRG